VIIEDLQKLSVDSPYIELFDIQINDTDYIHVTNYIEGVGTFAGSPEGSPPDLNLLQFPDFEDNATINTYFPVPCQLTGVEHKSEGQFPQPVFTIANILKTSTGNDSFAALTGSVSYDDILGFKIRRRRTLKKYLYGQPSYQAIPVELPVDEYYLDRVQDESPTTVSFVTVLPADITGVLLPRRNIIGNICSWKYKGAADNINEWEKVGGCIWRTDSRIKVGDQFVYAYVSQDDEYIVEGTTSFTPYSGSAVSQANYTTVESGLIKIRSNGQLYGGVTNLTGGDFQAASNTVYSSGHGFDTGDMVTLDTNGNSNPGGLADGESYFVRYSTSVSVYLYNTRADALADTNRIDITSSGSGTGYKLLISEYNYWQSTNGTATAPFDASGNWERLRVYNNYSGSSEYTAVYTDDSYNTYFLSSGKLWKNIGRSQDIGLVAAPTSGSLWESGDVCGKRLESCGKRFKVVPILQLSYNSASGSLLNGDIVRGDDDYSQGIVQSFTGTTSGTITFRRISGEFTLNEGLSSNRSPQWTAISGGKLSNFTADKFHTELDNSRTIPFGSFPTARVFQ
jgi:phage-related protein